LKLFSTPADKALIPKASSFPRHRSLLLRQILHQGFGS